MTRMIDASSINLTPEQEEAIEAVMDWLNDPEGVQVFRLFGYAGTGKTTTLKFILDAIEKRRPDIGQWLAAPTGKAAHVLGAKTGRKTTTLHAPGYIYYPVTSETVPEAHNGHIRDGRFIVTPAYNSKLADVSLVVIDEASMVGAEVHTDLMTMRGVIPPQSRDVRVLAVGDPAQLDPVAKAPAYTDSPGDIVLRDVLRQNPGPVLTAATWLRDNERFDRTAPELQAILKHEVPLGRLAEADAVIVRSNGTRLELTKRVREHVGKPAFEPVAGDTIMFRANQLSANIVNGTIALVGENGVHADAIAGHNVFDRVVDARIVSREGHNLYELTLRDGDLKVLTPTWIFSQERPYDSLMPQIHSLGRNEVVAPVQFAHVMTCHSSQGSEWEDVIIHDPNYEWKWLYTAITRARTSAAIAWRVTADVEDHSKFLSRWLDALESADVKPKVRETGQKIAELGQVRLLSGRATAEQLNMPQPTWRRHKAALTEVRLIDGDLLTLP